MSTLPSVKSVAVLGIFSTMTLIQGAELLDSQVHGIYHSFSLGKSP
jgi:hypothetical protein